MAAFAALCAVAAAAALWLRWDAHTTTHMRFHRDVDGAR